MLGEAADAEDVTQTTFLNAYRAFQQGTRPGEAAELADHDRAQRLPAAVPPGAAAPARGRVRRARRRGEPADDDHRAHRRGSAARALAAPAEPACRARHARARRLLVRRDRRRCSGSASRRSRRCCSARAARCASNSRSSSRARRPRSRSTSSSTGGHPARERRALRAHLRACAECNSLAQSQRAQRRALKSLVLVPLPATISHWMGDQTAAAATGAAGAGGLTAAGAAAGGGVPRRRLSSAESPRRSQRSSSPARSSEAAPTRASRTPHRRRWRVPQTPAAQDAFASVRRPAAVATAPAGSTFETPRTAQLRRGRRHPVAHGRAARRAQRRSKTRRALGRARLTLDRYAARSRRRSAIAHTPPSHRSPPARAGRQGRSAPRLPHPRRSRRIRPSALAKPVRPTPAHPVHPPSSQATRHAEQPAAVRSRNGNGNGEREPEREHGNGTGAATATGTATATTATARRPASRRRNRRTSGACGTDLAVELRGRIVTLEPLTPEHADGLRAAAADERTWTFMVTTRRRALAGGRVRRARGRHARAVRRPPRRHDRGLDELPQPRAGASAARDRQHVDESVRLGHRRERRGEVPAAPPRVRDARLPARRVQDRRAERAGARRARGAARASSKASTASTCSCAAASAATPRGTR